MFRPTILTFALLLVVRAAAKRNYSAPVYTICAFDWQPVMTCTKDNKLTGLGREEVDPIMKELGWKECVPSANTTSCNGTLKTGKKYYKYKCLPLNEILHDLLSPDGSKCHFGTALTVAANRTRRGMVFSYPLYRGILAVLSRAKYTSGNGWGFTRPITISVWVTVLVTGFVVVPFLLVVFDYISQQKKVPRNFREFTAGMSSAMWKSMTTLLQAGGSSIKTAEAKVVMIGYAFLVLIIIQVYTAHMISNLTVNRISADVNSRSELHGVKVGAVAVYHPRLIRHGIKNLINISTSSSTSDSALHALESGEVDALAMASEWMSEVLVQRNCKHSFHMFNLTTEPFDYALPFPSDFPLKILNEVNNQIVRFSETNKLRDLGTNRRGITCSPKGNDNSALTVLGLRHVYGVWVVMGGCVLLASMISMAKCALKKYRDHNLADIFQKMDEDGTLENPPTDSAAVSSDQTALLCAIEQEVQELKTGLSQQLQRAAKVISRRRRRWARTHHQQRLAVTRPRQGSPVASNSPK